jgi:hypothetical protein
LVFDALQLIQHKFSIDFFLAHPAFRGAVSKCMSGGV